MDDKQKWPLIHLYRRAAVIGDVPDLVCPEDESSLVPKLGPKEDPVLFCLSCGSIYTINIYMWNNMRDNLKEVYETIEFDWNEE